MAFGAGIDRRKLDKRNHVIDLFRQHRSLSKMQAKKLSGYSMDTTIAIIDRLSRERILVPSHGPQRPRGRKAFFYELNVHRHVYLGITFNQSGIHSSLVSFSNRVLGGSSVALDLDADRDQFISAFISHMKAVRGRHASLVHNIRAVGCAAPGEIDSARGVVLSYSLMPRLENLDVTSLVRQVFPEARVAVRHNIQCMTSFILSNSGLIRQYRGILLVSAGAGAANSFIYEGKIASEHGELGHVRVSDENRRCACGRRGCLDIYFSHRGLSEAVAGALKDAPDEERAPGGSLTMEWIAARYRQGDEAVVTTVDSRLRYFAAALLDAVNALNPDLVILSGELFSPFVDPVEKLTSMIREELGGAGLVTNFRKAKMVFMDLGADTAATGICHLLIRNEWGYGPQHAGRS